MPHRESARRSFLLLQNPLIKAKIDQYKKRLDNKAILSANETLRQITLEAGDIENPPRDRIRALELMAKYHGLLIQRAEIGKPGEFDKLTDEQVEEDIMSLLDRRPETELVM